MYTARGEQLLKLCAVLVTGRRHHDCYRSLKTCRRLTINNLAADQTAHL